MALRQYAKKAQKEETTVITARLPQGRYERFKSYCDDLGLSINEAVNLLIEIELKSEAKGENSADIQETQEDKNQVTIDDVINYSSDDEKNMNNKVNNEVNKNVSRETNNDDSAEMNTKVIQPKIINSAKSELAVTAEKKSTKMAKSDSAENNNNNKRFTVKPFVVDNQLPCPICYNWYDKSNFARHVKSQHNKNTEQFFTEHKDKALEMIETKKAELAAR